MLLPIFLVVLSPVRAALCSGQQNSCCPTCDDYRGQPEWQQITSELVCRNAFQRGLVCPDKCKPAKPNTYTYNLFKKQEGYTYNPYSKQMAFGVDPDKTSICAIEGEWYVHGMPTCVAAGGHSESCPKDKYCAGTLNRIGWGAQQAFAVNEVAKRVVQVRHSGCPASYKFKTYAAPNGAGVPPGFDDFNGDFAMTEDEEKLEYDPKYNPDLEASEPDYDYKYQNAHALAFSQPSVAPSSSILVNVLAVVGLATPFYVLWQRCTGDRVYKSVNQPADEL